MGGDLVMLWVCESLKGNWGEGSNGGSRWFCEGQKLQVEENVRRESSSPLVGTKLAVFYGNWLGAYSIWLKFRLPIFVGNWLFHFVISYEVKLIFLSRK